MTVLALGDARAGGSLGLISVKRREDFLASWLRGLFLLLLLLNCFCPPAGAE